MELIVSPFLMKKELNITNAELKVMNQIWTIGDMVTVPEMVEILNSQGEEWAYQTVATFLKNLEKKGFLSVTKKGKRLCYFPLIHYYIYIFSCLSIYYCTLFLYKFFDNIYDYLQY